METFEDNSTPEDLDEEEENSILKKKILELEIIRYMDRGE